MVISIGLVACNGLKKMVKKANTITYELVPNPLEMHGDSIVVNINGKFPEKYFQKKVVLTANPVIKYSGGERPLKPITLKGESIGDDTQGQVIKMAEGGKFSFTEKVPYTADLKNAEVFIKGTGVMKKKTKEFPEVKLGDGTIITPMLVMNSEMGMMAKDNFNRIVPVSKDADLHFQMSKSNIQPSELKMDDIKAFMDFISMGMQKGYTYKTIDIASYASPDGEQNMNADLAKDRGEAAAKYLMAEFKKMKSTLAENPAFFNKTSVAEDWDGFKELLSASSIKDKDMILRILSTYSDLDAREKEIKNISKTYVEIADDILPKLRRAKMTLNAEEPAKTDEQLKAMATSTPDSLKVEELMFAATLHNDMNTKLQIYQSVSRMYPQDWRGPNNVGYIYLTQNKVNEAQMEFEKANKLAAGKSEVQNNLGVVSRWKGDRKAAETYYKNVNAAGPETNHNLGIIYIMKGDYSGAVSSFGTSCTFNAALAKVLAKDNDGALTTLECSEDKASAMGYYLKAIIGARTGNNDLMINNIKSAINKDASLKARFKEDMEFKKYMENADFKGIVG